MSRVGKEPIILPDGVQVRLDGRNLTVTGPRGTLNHEIPGQIVLRLEEGQLRVERPTDQPLDRGLHGLTRTLVGNMVTGVTEGFTRVLEMVGVGYRAELRGRHLFLNIGYSHPVLIRAPEGIAFEIGQDGSIAVSGIDRYLVGQVAANIRAVRPPEPYKGKGIRYRGEYVRRKAGKTGAAGIG